MRLRVASFRPVSGAQGHGTRGVVTPYSGISLSEGASRTLRAGTRWNVAPGAMPGLEATMTAEELVMGPSFHLSSKAEQPGQAVFTAWGGFATGGFEGRKDDVTVDGDVTTGILGADAEWDRLLAGIMVSQSKGDGSYRGGPDLVRARALSEGNREGPPRLLDTDHPTPKRVNPGTDRALSCAVVSIVPAIITGSSISYAARSSSLPPRSEPIERCLGSRFEVVPVGCQGTRRRGTVSTTSVRTALDWRASFVCVPCPRCGSGNATRRSRTVVSNGASSSRSTSRARANSIPRTRSRSFSTPPPRTSSAMARGRERAGFSLFG